MEAIVPPSVIRAVRQRAPLTFDVCMQRIEPGTKTSVASTPDAEQMRTDACEQMRDKQMRDRRSNHHPEQLQCGATNGGYLVCLFKADLHSLNLSWTAITRAVPANECPATVLIRWSCQLIEDSSPLASLKPVKPVETSGQTKRTLAMCYPLNLNSPCRVFAPCDRKRWRPCREQDPPRLRAGFATGYFSSVTRFECEAEQNRWQSPGVGEFSVSLLTRIAAIGMLSLHLFISPFISPGH